MPIRLSARNQAWLWLWVFGALAAVANASEDPWAREAIMTWQDGSGLPGQRVQALVQTDDGYLWIATDRGLAYFDGKEFHALPLEEQHSDVNALARGNGGALWIGTARGEVLKRIGTKIETILPVGTPGLEPGIRILQEDRDGALWITTWNHQIGCFDHGKWNLRSTWKPILGGGAQVRVDSDRRPIVYSGVGVWRVTAGKLEEAMRWPSGSIASFHAIGKNGWWLSDGRRVALWRDGKPTGNPAPPKWGVRELTHGIEDRNGNLWLASAGHGVLRYGADGSVREFNADSGMGGNFILSLCEDSDGCIWVGTDGGGLSRITPGLFTLVGRRDGLASEQVTAVCPDGRGSIWVGTRGDGVCCISGGEVSRIRAADALWGTIEVTALASDSGGRVWVGTERQGLLPLKDGQTEERIPLPLGGAINALYHDQMGRLWIGQRTRNKVTVLEDGKPVVFDLANASGDIDIRVIAEDANGAMWFGTAGSGLWRWQDRKFQQFTGKDGLGGESVRALLPEADGSLWIGLESGGIARWQNGHFSVCARERGLPRGPIGGFLNDERDGLWWNARDGIFHLDKQALCDALGQPRLRLNLVHFDRADGLVDLEGEGGQSVACKTPDGRLWFATNHGVATARPGLYQPNNMMPPAVIKSVTVDGREIQNGAEIPDGARKIEFQLVGLDLAHTSGMRFFHRIDGLDDDWVNADSPVNYAHLPPGAYLFRVKAVNRDNVWSPQETLFRFKVLPPFWRTTWFVTSTVLAGVVLTTAITLLAARARLRRKLAAFRIKQALEEERSRIARDLHDQLGTSLTEIAFLGDALRHGLPEGQSSEGAAQLSLRARETIRAMDETVWVLNARNDRIESLVTYLSRSVSERCARVGLRCRINVPAQVNDHPIDAERRHAIFLACSEALHNVIKHARAAEVRFSFSQQAKRLAFEIKDDGRGFDPAAVTSGNGLLNLRERLAALKGVATIVSEPGEGACIRLELPLSEATSRTHPA